MMYTYKLIIEYDGTRYSGWQEQKNARTVAGEIRSAAEAVLGPVELGGAGRTDAGVHALAQVAHMRVKFTKGLKPLDLLHAVNDRLPSDINVVRLDPASPRFHARHDATARYYVYQIATHRTAFGKKYVWWVKDRLDIRAMKEALDHFRGFHNFVHFSQGDGGTEESDRRVRPPSTMADVHHLTLDAVPGMVHVRIGASHFLWKMVRRIVGTLAQVGRGKIRPADVLDLLRTGSPDIAAWTAPASGLFLERIEYPDDDSAKTTRPFNVPTIPRF